MLAHRRNAVSNASLARVVEARRVLDHVVIPKRERVGAPLDSALVWKRNSDSVNSFVTYDLKLVGRTHTHWRYS